MIILVGVAGSGKSTQSNLLCGSSHFQKLSVGELLRNNLSDDHKQDMLAGKVLADKEVIGYLEKELNDRGDDPELILDGFPRSVGQAEWLIDRVESGKLNVTAVVHLNLDIKSAKHRLVDRGRMDDHEPAISERFKEYELTIKPILKTLKEDGIPIIDIHAEQTEQQVHDEIVKKLLAIGQEI
jgi:adenylate kinase